MRKPGFPVELRLEGRCALVIGRDETTPEKVDRLLECGARVVLVDDERDPALAVAEVEWRARGFQEADLDGADLVLLTDRAVPERAARLRTLCDARRVPLWTHDALDTCDFTMTGLVRAGPVRLAVSTGAADPLLAGALRRALAAALDGDFVRWANEVAARWLKEPMAIHRQRVRGLAFSVRFPGTPRSGPDPEIDD